MFVVVPIKGDDHPRGPVFALVPTVELQQAVVERTRPDGTIEVVARYTIRARGGAHPSG